MRRIFSASFAALTVASTLLAAQDRYVRAVENENHDLVITRSSGERIVVAKSDRKWADETQVAFKQIAISEDGTAVGWAAYYPNCCTSYPIPILLEVYKAGKRHTFDPANGAPSHWCFIDGSARIAAISTTIHGPQDEEIELWDVSTGKKLDEFTWLDGESYPRAPAWVVAVRGTRALRTRTHQCSTK